MKYLYILVVFRYMIYIYILNRKTLKSLFISNTSIKKITINKSQFIRTRFHFLRNIHQLRFVTYSANIVKQVVFPELAIKSSV